jgi:hypothetical protein
MWNYEIYSDESGPAVDFLGQYERLEQDLRKVLRHVGIKEPIDIPRTNITGTRPDQMTIGISTRRGRAPWWRTGTRGRSRCWAMGFRSVRREGGRDSA